MLQARRGAGSFAVAELELAAQVAGMATQVAQLRILDEIPVSRELDLVSELFHRINRIIPEKQHLLVILPVQAGQIQSTLQGNCFAHAR
jgi:hypothetical protein